MGDPTEAQVRELAEGYTEAWGSQDAGRVAAFYSPDGSLQINDGVPAVGRDAIREAARGFMTAFPDMKVLMDALEIGEGSAVYRWTLIGSNTGPGGTGKRVRISGYEEWTIGADRLIANSLGNFDAEEYQRQLES
jgi:uncharacterized protein (TIGR02246 family)